MNAPVSIEAPSMVVAAGGYRLLMPIGFGLILLGLVFNKEVATAFQTWTTSTAYNHCFLVIPISLYLLWDRRADLAGIQARPTPSALLLGLPLAVLWLAAERLGIMEGRQLIAVSFVELLFLLMLGGRLWWAVAGPLLYLYFLVPFGEFLTPRLQDVTTFFIQNGLAVLGIPVYIDGYLIEIPQGTFFVAEACAGLRFLIASVAFGCLYALMMYRSPLRRVVFILVSTVVPIAANGLRGLGIVYLGYLLGSAQAAAADHIIYGWVFFSAVILLLIVLGLPFRQDEISTNPQAAAFPWSGEAVSIGRGVALALAVAVMASISPAVSAGLAITDKRPVFVPPAINLGSDCVTQPTGATGNTASQTVTCSAMPMDMSWEAFSPRSTAGPLMAERRRMVARALTEGLAEHWLQSADGASSAWRIMKSDDPAYLVAVAVWVDGKLVRPGLNMRLRTALNSLTGSAYEPIVVTVTPKIDWQTRDVATLDRAEAELLRFLLEHATLDQTIAGLSRLK